MISLPPLFFSIARNPITAVGLPLLGGMLSGSPTRRVVKGQWYNSLAFPPGQAPSQAFPIVWSVLYTGIGYASYIAVQEYDGYALESTRSAIATGLTVYYAQLGLNFAWTSFFFVKKWVRALLSVSSLVDVLIPTMFVSLELL
ncbi:hypothetical protein QCA50_000535 [Cerrena zonata]|uniref:Uncharacterized protein n=1 Tax=Cerrena zonata TaxID=2478898 RepID=A0AAW0H030_9APHY